MKASLQLRLSQHLALTPQLQQSIRLLQLSTLELQQEVAMAVAQNPLLENDEWIASPLRVAADGSLIAQSPPSSTPEPMHGGGSNGSEASGDRAERDDSRNGDDYDYDYNADSGDSGQWNLDDYGRSSGASDDDLPPLQVHEASTSLREHLSAQLRVTQAGPR
ncbi:MAG: RNA polymerase factor sigma-54, partial [Burkholderia gladioli]